MVVVMSGVIFPCEAFRTHTLSVANVKGILNYLPPGALDEYTHAGQPAGATPMIMICGTADRFDEREIIVRELLRLTASVNIKHRNSGATPILRAAGSGSTQMVELLLELAADPNVADNKGATPLDVAVRANAEAGTSTNIIIMIMFGNLFGFQPGANLRLSARPGFNQCLFFFEFPMPEEHVRRGNCL